MFEFEQSFFSLLQIQHFLQFVRSIYQHLPEHLDKIFEPRDPVRVKDLTEVNLDALLPITYTSLQIQIEKKLPDGKTVKDTVSLFLVYYSLPSQHKHDSLFSLTRSAVIWH